MSICSKLLPSQQWPRGSPRCPWPPCLCWTCFYAFYDAMEKCKGCLACSGGCVPCITSKTWKCTSCIPIHSLLLPIYQKHTKIWSELPCAARRASRIGAVVLRSTWRLRLCCWLTYTYTLPSGLAVAQLTSFRACCACDSQPHRPVALPPAIVAYKRTSLGCAQAGKSMAIHSAWNERGSTYLIVYCSNSEMDRSARASLQSCIGTAHD